MFENISLTLSAKNSIKSAISSGKLSHAIILEGSSKEVRLQVAKQLAAAVLCKSEQRPCYECLGCLKVKKDSHPDLHFLQKEKGSSMIKIDAIRNLKTQALVFPNDGEKSVFIISEAQDMNVQSQNALLKIFEEPAEHVCFILTCNSKSSLLQTILSRATCYFLGEEEKSEDDEKSLEAKKLAEELLLCLVKSNELEFIRKTAVFVKDKPLFKAVLEWTVPIIRDVIILQAGGTNVLTDCRDTVQQLKNVLTQKKAVKIFEELNKLADCVDASANHNLSITRFSAVLHSVVKG